MEITLSKMVELLTSSDTYVITAHINPDGDALGSLLALAAGLKKLNKQVTCLIDDDVPENFVQLPYINFIKKPSKPIKADYLIILDASDIERIGKVKEICQAPVLNIDHHISNTKFADYLYLDDSAAATGEIIFSMLKAMKVEFDKEIATCLYTAIATDCGFFKYANTTPNTMRTAAFLMEFGIHPNTISEEIEKRSLLSVQALARTLDSLEIHADGKIALITIDESILQICEQSEGFIDLPRSIAGVDIAVMIKQKEAAVCRISMRSKNTDVSLIALEFGGGGHKRAAGCTISLPLVQAKEKILQTIATYLKEEYHV